MKLKKWLLGLVTFAAMAVLCAVCAGAATYGDFEYSVLSDRAVKITDYNGSAEKVDIPKNIDGNSVTSIGNYAFRGCTSLTSVTIPDSVTEIGASTFEHCTSLKSITIPNSVTEIRGWAFYDCTSLTSITIPDSIKEIGSSAFSGCTSLASITIPNSVTSIGNYAFGYCTSLTSITIPNSVTSISTDAFYGCISLTSITIPNSVTEIGSYAFSGCTSLKNITIPDSVTDIGSYAFSGCRSLTAINVASENQNYVSVNGVLYNKKKTVLKCYPAGKKDKNYKILDGVTSIDDRAFYGCTGLTSVTMPGSVTSIGESAFEDCSSLTNITIPNSVTKIGWYAFKGCTSLKSITIPNSVTEIGGYAFNGCTSLTSITIPNSVTEIGYYVFSGCTSLTSIAIPDSLTNIDVDAFSGCTSLTAINVAAENQDYASLNGVLYNKDKTTIICYPAGKKDKNFKIPDSATEIGYSAFSGCTSLTSITIPNSVTYIGAASFNGCLSLTSITIPDSVTKMGNQVFCGCTSLTSIMIPDSVTLVYGDLFYGCTNLTEIKVANTNSEYVSVNGVLYNKDKTDLRCYPAGKKDKTYSILDGVTKIDYAAFGGCTSLVNVTIPDSVTSIGSSSFSGCTSLVNVTIPDSVTNIRSSAFSGCTSLTGITIPDSVTNIRSSAFSGCTSLTSITIPDSVTEIGKYAFSGCTSLTSITIPDSVTEIGDYTFADCISLTSITIPKNVTSIGYNAFGYIWSDYYDDYIDYYNNYIKLDNFKIYCYSDTAGEQYAKDNGFKYELLDKLTLAKVTGIKLGGRAADALRVNWTKNANASGYIVEMYQGNKWVRVAKITNNSTTTFRKAGLKAGTAYKFRVRAYKMSGKTAVYGAYSATVAARTNPSVIKGAKLGGRAADALRINWTKNTSADGYIVEMYQGNKWVRAAKITNNNTTTFRKAGLKASSVYKFRVRAYKMSGKTALYGNYSATVTARTNPSIVKGVKIGGKAKDALRVNWAKNASAQGYIVEMYKGGKWVRVAKITNGNTTTYRKAGLAKNTTYKFRVKAYYMSGKTALYGNYGSVSGKTAAK